MGRCLREEEEQKRLEAGPVRDVWERDVEPLLRSDPDG